MQHCTDNRADDGDSTVFDVLPTTCRDDVTTRVKTSSVYRFREVDLVKCTAISVPNKEMPAANFC